MGVSECVSEWVSEWVSGWVSETLTTHSLYPNHTPDRCGPTKFGSLPSYECHWEGCDFPSTFTQHLVAEHVRQRHLATFTATVAPPGSKNVATTSPSRSRTHRRQHEYTCEWTTCKVWLPAVKSWSDS